MLALAKRGPQLLRTRARAKVSEKSLARRGADTNLCSDLGGSAIEHARHVVRCKTSPQWLYNANATVSTALSFSNFKIDHSRAKHAPNNTYSCQSESVGKRSEDGIFRSSQPLPSQASGKAPPHVVFTAKN